jgi:hypothetical protein
MLVFSVVGNASIQEKKILEQKKARKKTQLDLVLKA